MDVPAAGPLSAATRDGIRILHVLAPAPFGGLERVVESLALQQSAAGNDVHVAAVVDPGVADHPLLLSLRAHGVAAHPLEVPARAYRYEQALVRGVCAQVHPHVMHTHGYRTDVLHTRIARELGIPAVSTSHGFTGGGLKNRVFEHLQRRAFRRCDAVVAVSRPMASMLLAAGVPRSRLHLVPNAWTGSVEFLPGHEARAALGIGDEEHCIGFVGRISPEKGPDVFVRALAQLPDDTRAVVIGDGPLRSALTERGRALGLEGRIRWAGAVENAGRLMKAFDAFVLSSRTEGTPVVLLEAMAAGVPVVATRVGGVPGVVSNREAILVPADDPTALAAAVHEALTNREAASWRCARAVERLETRFGAQRWLERYDRVYCAAGVHLPASSDSDTALV